MKRSSLNIIALFILILVSNLELFAQSNEIDEFFRSYLYKDDYKVVMIDKDMLNDLQEYPGDSSMNEVLSLAADYNRIWILKTDDPGIGRYLYNDVLNEIKNYGYVLFHDSSVGINSSFIFYTERNVNLYDFLLVKVDDHGCKVYLLKGVSNIEDIKQLKGNSLN